MPRRFLPARLDRKVCVTRPVLLKADPGRQVVVTRWGLVLVVRERGWTWYRWVLAGWWTSVVVEKSRTEAQVVREAARLIRLERERIRTRREPLSGADVVAMAVGLTEAKAYAMKAARSSAPLQRRRE